MMREPKQNISPTFPSSHLRTKSPHRFTHFSKHSVFYFWTYCIVGLFGFLGFMHHGEARPRKRRARIAKIGYKRAVRTARTRRTSRSRRRRVACHLLLKRSYALRYIRSHRRLESSLRLYIRHLRRCRLLRRFDRPRILVYDYRNCKMVAINQNMRTSAASLIKPFVMLAVYHKAQRSRRRVLSSRVRKHIKQMMRVSSNRSTNFLIRYTLGRGNTRRGLRYINSVLRRYSIHRTRLLELIPRGGRTYRNYTTARDLSILLYKIYRGRAISKRFSREMLRIMLHSRDNRGRTSYLRSHYDVRAATKTGYTRRTNGVAGIVLRGIKMRRTPYNFVGIITRPLVRANEWTWRRVSTRIVRRLSEMTYRHYAKGYAGREVRRLGGRRARGYCRR